MPRVQRPASRSEPESKLSARCPESARFHCADNTGAHANLQFLLRKETHLFNCQLFALACFRVQLLYGEKQRRKTEDARAA